MLVVRQQFRKHIGDEHCTGNIMRAEIRAFFENGNPVFEIDYLTLLVSVLNIFIMFLNEVGQMNCAA